MRTARAAVAVLLSAAVCTSAVVAAADWPQWRGPNRDGHAAAGAVAPAELAASLKVVWKTEVGFGLDSPVVAGGKVFYLDEQKNKEVAHAADAATGKVLWSTELDDAFKDSQSQAGPRCTAVVDGDRVYVQSARGQLKCLAVADGKQVWASSAVKDFGATFIGEKGKAEGSSRHGYTGAPLVDGDHLIAGVGGKDAAYVCFEKATGQVVWKSALEDIPAYSAPIVATIAGVRQVVAFTTAGVVGIDRANGKQLWRVPVKTALGRHVTTPTVIGDMVVVGSFQAGLIGVRVSKTGDGLKAEQAWANKEALPNFSSPVLVGAPAAGGEGASAGVAAAGGTHVIGVGQGLKLFCAEVATGKVGWSQDAGLGKAHAGLIVVGRQVLALGDAGELVMFAADPAAYREGVRAQVCGKNWCVPAYADGRLYLRDARELKCLELGK